MAASIRGSDIIDGSGVVGDVDDTDLLVFVFAGDRRSTARHSRPLRRATVAQLTDVDIILRTTLDDVLVGGFIETRTRRHSPGSPAMISSTAEAGPTRCGTTSTRGLVQLGDLGWGEPKAVPMFSSMCAIWVMPGIG